MNREISPSRRRPKRVLAVRMLMAKVAWLDGQPFWRDGSVTWEGATGSLTPRPADLARAQRSLNKITRYPIASETAMGDSAAWLQARHARLELAKKLSALSAPDLPALGRRASTRNPQIAQRLTGLLLAEAFCLNRLPALPSAALLACGERAAPPLRALLDDAGTPLPARALAALTLGVLHRAGERPLSHVKWEEAWLRRAYAWGAREGLPLEPALIVTLLAEKDGPELARRILVALSSCSPFALSPEFLRERLAGGVPAAQVVALAEAAAATEPLAARMLQRRVELPEGRPRHERQAQAELLRQQRQEAITSLAELLIGYVRATDDPEIVCLVARFTHLMLDLHALTPALAEAILTPLRYGLKLKPELHKPYLETLVERHGDFWDKANMPAGKRRCPESNLREWLQARWGNDVKPFWKLLQVTGEIEVAREALERNLHALLSDPDWRDPDLYRFVLSLVREFCPTNGFNLAWSFCRELHNFPTAHAARVAFQPLLDVFRASKAPRRTHFLEIVLAELPYTREERRNALARLPRYIPCLLRFVGAHTDEGGVCEALITGALTLDRAAPEQAVVWLDWLQNYLLKRFQHSDFTCRQSEALGLAISLGVALAGGDLARFQGIVQTVLKHAFPQDAHRIESGLEALKRFPALRAPLAHLFPQQPQRCVELLVRVGLALQLGEEALAPLRLLEGQDLDKGMGRDGIEGDTTLSDGIERDTTLNGVTLNDGINSFAVEPSAVCPADTEPTVSERASESAGWEGQDWQAVLELSPELAPVVAAYRHARTLTGGALDAPSGARRALELPVKLARELAYVEQAAHQKPERAALDARAIKLRTRLADEEGLRAAMRAEVRERLTQITAEAQLAAAEQQALACYRARLASVAGPLPPDLNLTADLLNATLLASDIEKNRRLLLRLLRAHLNGDTTWREQHPANVAFLLGLAQRGVDTAAWLAAHPRAYRCPGAAGGRVRLRLETDPLHILQMGNYFDTCLSFGGMNAFSTVANASELNKRVIYAYDGAGHVVGRKLIGIEAQGGLIGYRAYTALTSDADNAALRAIFRRYAGDFAARCRLELANGGTVPTLFAEAWYDDGWMDWSQEEPAPHTSPSACIPQTGRKRSQPGAKAVERQNGEESGAALPKLPVGKP